MLERTVKAAVKKCLNEIGAYHHWPVQTGYGAPCLDCHGCYKHLYFAIETKQPGKQPTKLQLSTISRIRAAGGLVFIVDSPESAHECAADIKAYGDDFSALYGAHPRAVE